MLWDAAKRFSENHAYAGREFPVSGGDSPCVLCLQPLRAPGTSVMTRLDRFVRDDIQVRREESRRIQAGLLKKLTSLEVFEGAVNSHMQDLQVSHSGEIDAVKKLLRQYETAQKAAVTIASTEERHPSQVQRQTKSRTWWRNCGERQLSREG